MFHLSARWAGLVPAQRKLAARASMRRRAGPQAPVRMRNFPLYPVGPWDMALAFVAAASTPRYFQCSLTIAPPVNE